MDEYTRAIAAILKTAQQQEGQPSYSELASITGLGRATVERLLNGRRDIHLRYLRELCAALGLDPAQVVDDAEKAIEESEKS